MLRNQQTGVAGSRSLAPAGQLGASQAGMRLTYNIDRLLALSGRLSTPVGQRGGEGALGVRVHPHNQHSHLAHRRASPAHRPIWRRAQRLCLVPRGRALSAAAAVALQPGRLFPGGRRRREEPRPVRRWRGGVTRPLFGKYSGGFGIWGGAQPGLARLDVGPRLTMRMRKNVKVHLDWRQKLVGNARPGSGPALTLAGDF